MIRINPVYLKPYRAYISLLQFIIFTARRNVRIASAVLAKAIPSVRPSVRHTPVLCQNNGM